MSNKLFEPVQEGHDGKGRVVFICQDKNGFYVFKPQVAFKTRHWKKLSDKKLQACFDRQVGCTQNTGFFEKGEVPAIDEDYSLEEASEQTDATAEIPPVVIPPVEALEQTDATAEIPPVVIPPVEASEQTDATAEIPPVVIPPVEA